MKTTEAIEKYKQSIERVFRNQDVSSTFIRFDGHTARSEFLRNCWNYAIDEGWIRAVQVDLEQETFFKGFLTEKGQAEVLNG